MLAHLKSLDQVRLGRLVLGGLCLLLAAGYLMIAVTIPLGSETSPGPGLFPVIVGIAGILISLLVIVESIASTASSGEVDWPRGTKLRLVLTFFGVSAAFILLLPILGQYLAAALYLFVMLRVFSTYKWWKILLLGVIISVTISWLFIEIFQIPLPTGIW